jgi:threonine dehydrogenase-like Zn-dependent dehydrogenase
MKAAIVESPGRLVVRQIPEPTGGEYDALCELLFGATCTGTDQHIIDNCLPWEISYPTVLGHESIGRVVKVGSKVRHFRVGDVVTRVGTPPPNDGSATVTWGGFTQFGIARDHWQARRDGLPASFWDAHRVNQIFPSGIDLAAATMIITFRETLSYVTRVGFAAGRSALVIGSGGTGLAFVAHARHMGLKSIACVGSGTRRGAAQSAGASLWCDYRDDDAVNPLRESHPAGFDFIIDSVGREGSLTRLLPLLAVNGAVAVYGLDEPDKVMISPFARGTYHAYNGGYDEEESHQRVVDLMRRGELDARLWLDLQKIYPLDDIADAFTALKERKQIKAVVRLSNG